MRLPRINSVALALAAAMVTGPRPLPAQTQASVSLSTLLTAFLADSGVRTRGLPWTTGKELPVVWQSEAPVKIPYPTQDGTTVARSGTALVGFEDGSTTDATIEVAGSEVGIQRVAVWFDAPELPRNLIVAEEALTARGIALTPLKCRRDTEGATYGNLVYVIKAPGKTASALHESWNCAHDGCRATVALVYRKRDLTGITCFGE